MWNGTSKKAVFIARNCASRSGRENWVRELSRRIGVDSTSSCLRTRSWPLCGGTKCSKIAVLKQYPFYLAFENSIEEDYVTEKVFEGLEAGVLPVYLGAPNIANFVPRNSIVDASKFQDPDDLAAYLQRLLDTPDEYRSHFQWKNEPLSADFQHRFHFLNLHSDCRLCRWAFSRKFGFKWEQPRQAPDLASSERVHVTAVQDTIAANAEEQLERARRWRQSSVHQGGVSEFIGPGSRVDAPHHHATQHRPWNRRERRGGWGKIAAAAV